MSILQLLLGGTGPKATGGTIVLDGGSFIHVFTGAGTFQVTNSTLTSVEVLAIGGGGGGGGDNGVGNTGGSGGAGGAVYYTAYPVSITPGAYTVAVGGGGAGSLSVNGTRGTDSSFGPATGLGGAGGAQWLNSPASPGGGCGAGGGGYLAAATNGLQPSQPQPVPGATNYGGNGGAAGPGNPGDSAGGGGIGGNGAPSPDGGAGGAGLQFSQFAGPIIGIPALSPLNGFFGGGGGGQTLSVSLRPASAGGGGLYPGLTPTAQFNGFEFTGGGGASGGPLGVGNGGKGIVLVRYPV